MSGNVEDSFSCAPATIESCRPNYRLGVSFCSCLAAKFNGAAAQWWHDYGSRGDSAEPNFWKKAKSARFT